MAQNFDLGLSFYFMSKIGYFLVIFFNINFTFHKIKTKIKILRHASLHLYLINTCSKFERISWKNKCDIHVKKM